MGVDVELVVYPGAGHGWDNPYPQHFVDGAVVTRDCLMRWTADGESIEVTSGHSMDSAIGAIRALASCSHRDGYTMGRNDAAFSQSLTDLHGFLRASWDLP
jgi:dienelactone hydrolase